MFRSFKSRISATFFLVTMLVSAFFFATLYSKAVENEIENLRSYLKSTAALGASFLEGNEALKVPLQGGCEKSLIRQQLIQDLKKITQIDPRLDDAYILVPSGKEGVFFFVANANQEESPTACGEAYNVTPFPELTNGLKAPAADRKITRDKWGEWLSGYAPIHDFTGQSIGILGLDVAAKTVKELQWAFMKRFIIVMAAAFILAFLIGALSSQWLVRPIDQIITGMERVSEGDMNYFLKSLPQAEFNRIVTIFNRMTVSLKNIMNELASTVRKSERVNRELEIAADLQKRALPERPPLLKDLDIAAKSIPAKEVGGDYFDFLTADPDKVGFVIADAAGKGFPGTIYMTNSRSIFRVVSSEESVPRTTLQRTNDFISNDASSSTGLFITFLYSLYDRKTRRLTCSNAGHYLPIVYDSGGRRFKTMHAGGLPLGIYPEQEYPEETVQLAPGDVVVMYTDGVIEAVNSKRDMFGLARLMKLIEANPGETAAWLLTRIESEIAAFTGEEPQFDDITLIVFKVT
ncbi:MAG: PP2C family protein-serine/threonine phosphatase [Candidatus Omnitrophota bacterium]